jgi:hypothetical protein
MNSVWVDGSAGGVEERGRGTDCFSRDGLVARALRADVQTRMRTALQGFISDPEEEAELRSRAYQAERVHALAIGIQRYLSKSPPLARSRPLSRQS